MADGDAVGPEHEMDVGALSRPRHVFPQADVHGRVRLGAGHAPPGDAGTIGHDVKTKFHTAGRNILHAQNLKNCTARASKHDRHNIIPEGDALIYGSVGEARRPNAIILSTLDVDP